jgi:hypothetical protein
VGLSVRDSKRSWFCVHMEFNAKEYMRLVCKSAMMPVGSIGKVSLQRHGGSSRKTRATLGVLSIFMRHLGRWPGNRWDVRAVVGAGVGAGVEGSRFGEREVLCCPAGQWDAMCVCASKGLCSISRGGEPSVM